MVILASDLVCLLGGTVGMPVVESVYWLRAPLFGQMALWNSHLRQSLEALGILWMLRSLVLGQTILAWTFCHYLVNFHCLCYSEQETLRRRMGNRLWVVAAWHLLARVGHAAIFWGAYLPLIVGAPTSASSGMRGSVGWRMAMVRDRTVGWAPVVALSTLPLDLVMVVVVSLYRARQDRVQKLSAYRLQGTTPSSLV